jgi:cytochrome c oxidase subunit 2
MKSRVNAQGHRGTARTAPIGAPRRTSGRGPWRLPAALLPLLAAACGPDHVKQYPQTVFAPTTEMGRIQGDLLNLTLWLGIGVGLIVFAAMAYVMVRFRYRPDGAEPQQVHGNTRLEILWTLIPAVILAAIAVPTVDAIWKTQPEAPADALTVTVVGKQWWWEFRYPHPNGRDTIVTANEVHVPVGRTVQLLLKSDNVLHSFWVPQMGGKRDLVPNRINKLVFKPEQAGIYYGQCAEFCGASHALMRMRLVAHPDQAAFDAWLANEAAPAVEPTDSAVAIGRTLVTKGACAGCHTIKGVETMRGVTGPNLTHFGRRRTLAGGIRENNAQELAAWLRDPPAVKPGSLMPDLNLKEEEIPYIVAYLQSLQ